MAWINTHVTEATWDHLLSTFAKIWRSILKVFERITYILREKAKKVPSQYEINILYNLL